jgi:hypothetical protein
MRRHRHLHLQAALPPFRAHEPHRPRFLCKVPHCDALVATCDKCLCFTHCFDYSLNSDAAPCRSPNHRHSIRMAWRQLQETSRHVHQIMIKQEFLFLFFWFLGSCLSGKVTVPPSPKLPVCLPPSSSSSFVWGGGPPIFSLRPDVHLPPPLVVLLNSASTSASTWSERNTSSSARAAHSSIFLAPAVAPEFVLLERVSGPGQCSQQLRCIASARAEQDDACACRGGAWFSSERR